MTSYHLHLPGTQAQRRPFQCQRPRDQRRDGLHGAAVVVSRVVAAALADGPEEDHPEGDRREVAAWVAHRRQREER